MSSKKRRKRKIQFFEPGEELQINKRWFYFLAAAVPMTIIAVVFICHGMYPFGDHTYLRVDFYHQYAPFARDFCNRIRNGEDMLYAWNLGLGSNYTAMFTYYLASPTNFFLLFVPQKFILEALDAQIIIKCGISSLCFAFYLVKKFEKRRPETLAFSWMFALSAYFLAYAGNIIWLDNMALLPLVVWGLEELIQNKKCRWYCITMGICIFSNFYMAFLLGLFLVLYFIVQVISTKKFGFKRLLGAVGRFALCTVLLLCVCAFLILPMAYALSNTQAGDSDFPKKIEFYYSFAELFQRMMLNVELNLLGNEVPNIFASVSILLLIPFYFCNKDIKLREKITKGILLVFFLFSFNVNILDYCWHGLHYPNSFPARESGFFVFLCVTMAYEAYDKRKSLHWVTYIVVSIYMVAAFIASWLFTPEGENTYGLLVYLSTAIALAVYMAVFLWQHFAKNKNPRLMAFIMLGVIVAEIGVNVGVTGFTSVITRSKYQKYAYDIDQIIEELEASNSEFFRVEKLDRTTNNDASWNYYRGTSYFSSTVDGELKEFMSDMGMRTSSVSYSHIGATPFTDMLFGVKYLIAEDERKISDVSMLYQTPDDDNSLYVYENYYSLPMGYMIDANAGEDWEKITKEHSKNPFEVQNALASRLTTSQNKIFYKVPNELALREDDGSGVEKYDRTIHVFDDEHLFVFVNTYTDEVKITINDIDGEEVSEKTYDDLKFKYIIDLGERTAGEVIRITPTETEKEKIDIQSYALDEHALQQVYSQLSESTLTVGIVQTNHFRATINAANDGMLLTSIPYDEGWKVTVDDVEIEPQSFGSALMCLPISQGEHVIKMSFIPKGLIAGVMISAGGIAVLGLWCGYKFYIKNRKPKKKKGKSK